MYFKDFLSSHIIEHLLTLVINIEKTQSNSETLLVTRISPSGILLMMFTMKLVVLFTFLASSFALDSATVDSAKDDINDFLKSTGGSQKVVRLSKYSIEN